MARFPSPASQNIPTYLGTDYPTSQAPRGHKSFAMARRESLSEILAANPELSLSGSIISAAFNIPHALTYRKGGDWVCHS